MNSTEITVYFSNVEKGFLPVVFVPCALLCLLIYKFAKRPLERASGETIARRMQYLYAAGSGILFGEVLFHVAPFLTRAYRATLGLGLLAAICVEAFLPRLSRDGHSGAHSVVELEHSVDFEEVKINDRLMVDDCLDDDYAEQASAMADEEFELKKRRVVVGLFVCALLPYVLLEGFYYASFPAPTPALQIVAFYLDKLLQTLVLCSMLVHAFLHGVKHRQWPWYLIVCAGWLLLCALSTLSGELGYNFMTEFGAIVAVNGLYSILGGILLVMAMYLKGLVQAQQERAYDTRSTVLRLLCFAGAFMLSGLITVFI